VQFIPTVQGALSARVTVTSDAANSPQTVNLTGTGTPSAVTFSPAGGGTFPTRRRVGTLSTPHVVTLTNRTNSPLVISSVKIAGLNPKSFRITGGTCNGATIQPDHSCTEAVAFGPSVAGTRSATLQVTDNGPNSPHSLSLAGIAIPPKNDRLVRAAVGCQSTHITWVRPSGSRYVGTAIYRNRVRVPRYAGDGLLVKHGTGGLIDRHLLHFTTYNYRIFAKYRSQVTPGTYNYSKGVILKLRTGEVCSPLNNARTTDTTPLVTWLPSPTLHGYALLVYHAGKRVFKPLRSSTTHYQLTSARHLRRGSIYTIFLYAYPPSAPRGKFIGKTTFVVV
jgi:hypothetical protein